MKALLEDLWLNYQLDKNRDISDESQRLLSELTEKQNELYSELNESQIELLERYEEIRSMLNCAYEKESFLQGASFAVTFILEALKE